MTCVKGGRRGAGRRAGARGPGLPSAGAGRRARPWRFPHEPRRWVEALQEVVVSARALTGARYGAIATVDDGAGIQESASSGFTPDDHKQLAAWSGGPRLFEHFRDLAAPSRLADLPA